MVDAALRSATNLGYEGIALGFHGAEAATAGARAALWDGDARAARRYLDAYATARVGRRTDAMRVTIEAGIAAVEGGAHEARQRYGDAQRQWEELGLGTWLAFCRLDIVETGALEPAERRRGGAGLLQADGCHAAPAAPGCRRGPRRLDGVRRTGRTRTSWLHGRPCRVRGDACPLTH
jgi:hypothetical protein